MMLSGLFSQIIVVAVAIGVIVAYVQPAFVSIGDIQDDISVYQEELAKVQSVNDSLNQLAQQLNQVSAADRTALVTYMPDEVDPIAVSRHILFIATDAGVLLRNVVHAGIRDDFLSTPETTSAPGTIHSFEVAVDGRYEQIKDFLLLLERNNYPLEVHNFDLSPLEGGFMAAQVELVTYGYLVPPEDASI